MAELADERRDRVRADVRGLAERVLRTIMSFPSSPPSLVDSLLAEINKFKECHQLACDLFTKNLHAALPLDLYRAKWGELVDYSYSRRYYVHEMKVEKTLLSALVAERLLLARHRGYLKHVTVGIVGISGSGKTTYSVASAIGGLSIAGYSREKAMEVVSSLMFFEPKPFVKFVERALSERVWVPIVVLDDVGAQISKYWLWLGERWWAHLFSILDHLKDWCGVLVITASSFSAVPSRLRDKIDIVVEASEVTLGGYAMNLMLWYRRDKYFSPGRGRPLYVDVFPPTAMMHRELWQAMMDRRRELGLKRVGVVIEALRKLEEESQGVEPEPGDVGVGQ